MNHDETELDPPAGDDGAGRMSKTKTHGTILDSSGVDPTVGEPSGTATGPLGPRPEGQAAARPDAVREAYTPGDGRPTILPKLDWGPVVRELLALGGANLAAGLFSGMLASRSPSQSSRNPVRAKSRRHGVLERVPAERIFPTVGTAVTGYIRASGETWTDWEEGGNGPEVRESGP